MTTPKLTPDQLHRLIDEVAELVDEELVFAVYIHHACTTAGCEWWWYVIGRDTYLRAGRGHAGLSAVLILLSEGG